MTVAARIARPVGVARAAVGKGNSLAITHVHHHRQVDAQTLAAYDAEATQLAALWSSRAPTQMYALLTKFFTAGPTVDIGCGAGRDVGWLNAHGYPTIGVDASRELVAHAKQSVPGATFLLDELPDLSGLDEATFANVLCQTVLPHLPQEQVMPAVARLLALLAPGGTLYLSWVRLFWSDVRRLWVGRR